MSKLYFQIALAVFGLLVALFLLFPGIDLWMTSRLWNENDGFWGWQFSGIDWLHRHLGRFLVTVFTGLSIAWLLCRFNRAPRFISRYRKNLFFLILAIVVGPGLVVNAFFKDQWGRPRPYEIQNFGGTKTFTPAWVISNQCGRNCSFVCGDASIGFVLIAGIFISRRPRLWFMGSLFAGGLLGLMRVAQGGHFLSDVIFCWYAVALSAWLLARVLKVGIYSQEANKQNLAPAIS